jgi:2-dehydropantoate 2-reductase
VKIVIVGAGAVGLYYGAHLATQNPDVHFLLRSDYGTVKARGIAVLSPAGDFVLHPVNTHRFSSEIGACDLVVIALKATANDALLDLLPPLIEENTMLLTLQNGLGNEEFLGAHFGAARVLGGKCFVCLNRIAPGVVKHIGHGAITLGEFGRKSQARTHEVARAFEESGVRCEVCENIEEVLWRKLTWNIPFNGLSIAASQNDAGKRVGITVGQIIADAALLDETKILMRETIAIAAAHGVLIEDEYIEFQIERTKKMGDYKPSSLLDYEAWREIEIEPIWGEPLRRAQALGVSTPRLQDLLGRLRATATP